MARPCQGFTPGIAGTRRGKRVRTTNPTPPRGAASRSGGPGFTATAPNQLRVTDLTFVPTWAGVAHVCLITDAFSRMIVGWRAAGHMRTTMVLDAIEMARWSRGKTLAGLRCHSDAGSQFTSIRYGERLAEIGALPSTGTVGDIRRRPSRNRQRLLQVRTHLRTGPHRTLENRRRRRTGHAWLGALAQHQPPTRLPQRHTARRVRSHVLRSETDRPTPGRNPIAQSLHQNTIRTRAIHF